MALHALVIFLCTLGVCQEGLTALTQTQQTVMAAAGEQACLKCELTVPKEVHQVTWQKLLPDGERNVATFSKYTGQRVNPGFQGKVEFKDAGLQNSSIVIREVKEQDEGCYRCLFNTYPDGALMCSTCLKLYELHGPFLHVMESNSSEEAVVSCSATAQPAPTVTLRVLNLKLNSSSYSESHANGTVTVSATAVLQRSFDNSTEVECEVQVPSVAPKKVSETVPEVKQALAYRHESETGSSSIVFMWIIPSVLVVLLGVWGLAKQRQLNRRTVKDPEEIKTPQRPAETRFATPLLQQQDEKSGARMRSSVMKDKIKSPHSSSVKAGCKRTLFDDSSPETPGKI